MYTIAAMNNLGRTQNESGTKWQSVVTRIEQQFSAGGHRAGESFPTLGALCEQYGISNTTGRRVVQELKSRGYIAARGRAGTRVLRTTLRPETVYLCLRPEAIQAGRSLLNSVYFIHEFMAGFAESAPGRMFKLAPVSSDFVFCNLDRFAGRQVLVSANVIIRQRGERMEPDQDLADRLHERLQPIFFHGFPGLGNVIQLGTDLHSSLALPVKHLAGLGHTRIGLVIGDTRSVWARERLLGYMDALNEANIGFAPERMAVVPDILDAAGDAALERLLDPSNGLTALACATDRLALAVLERCRRRGIRVPENLAVTGSDNIPEANLSLPPLTSVDGRDREKGAFAVELLQRRLGGEVLAPVVHTFEPRLIVRESSGAAAAEPGESPPAVACSCTKQVG